MTTTCLIALALMIPQLTHAKSAPRLERITNPSLQTIRALPQLAASDTCNVSPLENVVYRIDGWVTGNELYKTYMDPATNCPNPYPYKIAEINLPMAFDDACELVVSVDIELSDDITYPGCHVPGEPVAISKDWTLQVPPGGGMFNIWIPLDTPITVTKPFFAGFFLGNAIDASVNPAVLSSDVGVECISYNIWDDQIGWIDLINNDYYNFPGNLAMEVSGVPGGTGGGGGPQPVPAPVILSPLPSEQIFGNVELWADDTSGSSIIKYVKFEYSFNSGAFVEIGKDFDGTSPIRSGTAAAASGSGFSMNWNPGAVTEGNYVIKATSVDTLNRSTSVQTTVFLEPTPPTPTITSPASGSSFCDPLSVTISCNDENMSYIELYRQEAGLTYHSGLTAMSQFTVGDNNGNPNDNNFVSNGEFGDYYSGPCAAAMAVKLWNDRGFSDIMKSGASSLSMTAVAELLATQFHTRADHGTNDEYLYRGMVNYASSKGSQFAVDHMRNPNYFQMRTWLEDEERAVMIGLSGAKGIWLTLEGFNGWVQTDGSYRVYVASPLSGAIEELPVRNSGLFSEIYFNSNWQRIDIMVSLTVTTWTVSRSLVKVDNNGNDGWSFNWTPTGLTENSLYLFRAIGRDATAYRNSSTILLRYKCAGVYATGDYNNDTFADIGDLLMLIEFLTSGGAAPTGGAARADANCDNTINIADAVFYMNFLFNATSSPCR